MSLTESLIEQIATERAARVAAEGALAAVTAELEGIRGRIVAKMRWHASNRDALCATDSPLHYDFHDHAINALRALLDAGAAEVGDHGE